jgi:murein DD-endopeptidase
MTSTRTITRGAIALVAALAVLFAALVGSAPAHAAATTSVGTVRAGVTLEPGSTVTSPNGQFRLVLQGDGNVVLYGIGNAVLWASNTASQPGASLRLRTDGKLVLVRGTSTVWATNTAGLGITSLTVGDDADIALRNAAGTMKWHTGSFQSQVAAGVVLKPGTTLRSDTRNTTRLVMQTDGNLVQYTGTKAVWASHTTGRGATYAAVQTDGNLVVYSAANVPLWASHTTKYGKGQLLVQVDGNVVLYGKAGTRAWSTLPLSKLKWPVVSKNITGRFGDDRGPGHTPRYHQGADAGVGVGTPVYGSATGTVTATVTGNPTFGNYVIVTYGLTTVLTAHLSSISVTKGQTVTVNTVIAKSGNTGQSTGPHVHVETRVNGTLVDPLKTLSFR